MPSSRLTLVVLAAGRSTRYGQLKQLDPIGPGRATLLEYSLFDAARAGFSRFVVVIQGDLEDAFTSQLRLAVASGLDVRLVHQPDHDPEWTGPPRVRPWGTGFAVGASRHAVDGQFGVCNADDFYGRRAFHALADGLLGIGSTDSSALLVSYPLGETLSRSGGVSRGLCVRGRGQHLAGIREAFELVTLGDQVHGVDVNGVPLTTEMDTPVSMNLWGFQPRFIEQLAVSFTDFLNAGPGETDEFYLSEVVGRLVAERRLVCRLVEDGEGWLGVTFPEDREWVASRLASLVDSGVYPPSLWGTPLAEVDGR